jgi:hypothetical protein
MIYQNDGLTDSRPHAVCMYAPSGRSPPPMGVSHLVSLYGSTPPTGNADIISFLLAFGVHLNILCVIAQLLLQRQALMDSPS